MRLLVTGSRHGRDDVTYWLDRWVAKFGEPELVILGDSHAWVHERGVDLIAYEWVKQRGYKHVQELAHARLPWTERFRERDQRMANHLRRDDWALGFPVDDSRGTWLTLRFSAERGARTVALPYRSPRALESAPLR